MGWNIFYKECKYLAAHKILRVLHKYNAKYALHNPGDTATNFKDIKPSFQWVSIGEIKKRTPLFSNHLILDSLNMLYQSSHNTFEREIDLLTSNKISETKAKIQWEGETALKDRKYIRMFFKSAKVIIPLLIALGTLLLQYLRCLLK